jgi:hypothetical protein
MYSLFLGAERPVESVSCPAPFLLFAQVHINNILYAAPASGADVPTADFCEMYVADVKF